MKLRNYQRHAVASLFTYFQENPIGNPLIVCPTASGKSVIQADFIKQAFEYPNQRWLLLSHVMELIDQNHQRLIGYWPQAPAGVYCAKLKKKQTDQPITVASIQSIHNKAALFGYVDGVIVDEAHLINQENEGMYRRFFEALQAYNPNLKVIGLTATPYRLKTGMLHEGKNRLFHDIAFSISVNMLLRDGYICPLKSKQSKNTVDMAGIKTIAGEFSLPEMAKRMDTDDITGTVLDEVMQLGEDRQSWLFFCAGVDHAYHIRDELRNRGINAETVEGNLHPDERNRILEEFKSGKIRAITNFGVLTTGFDCPRLDLLVVLRATKSASLWVQICGRGMRLFGATYEESISNGKRDCLVLDYGGNVMRFGPINMMDIKNDDRQFGKASPGIGKAPFKICPQCREVQNAHYATCADCGYEFPKKAYTHAITAASGEIIAMDEHDPSVIDYTVDKTKYSKHVNKEGLPSLRIDFTCGLQTFTDWLSLEHPQTFRKAMIKWCSMAKDKYKDAPRTVDEALLRLDDLQSPGKISVTKEGKYFVVVGIQSYIENGTEAA